MVRFFWIVSRQPVGVMGVVVPVVGVVLGYLIYWLGYVFGVGGELELVRVCYFNEFRVVVPFALLVS